MTLFLKEEFLSQRFKKNHNPHFNIYKLAIFYQPHFTGKTIGAERDKDPA